MISSNNPLILAGKNYVYLVTDKGFTEVKNIKDLKNQISDSKVKLVSGHDTSHYNLLEFTKEELIDKKKVQAELQKLIPSSLNNVTWRYKEIEGKKDVHKYWAFTLEDQLINPFIKTLEESGFTISQISFFPHLVSKSIPEPKKPTLLIFLKNKVKFLSFIWQDKFITYDLKDLETFKDDISGFISLIKSKYDIDVKHIISISDRNLDSLKIKIESINFDIKNIDTTPLISDYKYKDQKEIEKQKEEEKDNKKEYSAKKDEDKKEKPKNNLPRLLLILLASILFMGLVFLPKVFGKKDTPQPEIVEETITVIESPLPSPSPTFYPNLYSIQVLNGTKVGGLATTTKELLEDNGYQDVEIGNSEDDYILTEIITDNDEELIENLSKILENDFIINTAKSTTSLTEDLDAIVILGNKK